MTIYAVENVEQCFNQLVESKNNGKGSIIMGEVGVGKTVTMNRFIHEVIYNNIETEQRRFLLYSTNQVRINQISRHIYDHAPSATIARDLRMLYNNTIYNPPENRGIGLFIDDIGNGSSSIPIYGAILYPVVDVLQNFFMNGENPNYLYFTSNLGPEELQRVVGPRLWDRIIQKCDIIILNGPNLRNPENPNS